MDFQLSETQNEIVEMTRKFAKAEIFNLHINMLQIALTISQDSLTLHH